MLGILSLHAHRQMIYYHCDCIRFASKHSTEGFAVLILFPFLIFSFLFLMLGFLAYDSIFFFFFATVSCKHVFVLRCSSRND